MAAKQLKMHRDKPNPYQERFGTKIFNFIDPVFDKAKNGEEMIVRVEIDKAELIDFYATLGYYRVDVNNNPTLVKVQQKIITIVEPINLQDEFFDIITNLHFMQNHLHPDLEDNNQEFNLKLIKQKFYNGIKNLFSTDYLYRNILPQPKFVEHTANRAYVFYNNNAVEITATAAKGVDYASLHGYLWAGQIIDRPAPALDKPTNLPGVWEQFIDKITGRIINEKWQPDLDRKKHLMCAIGYLMHRYFEGKRRAVLLIDSSLDDADNGRTGKTLLGKGLAYAMGKGVNEINGKDFDTRDPKRYRLCNLETAIVVLNDLRKHFPVDMLFNDITEGIQIHRNHEEPYVHNAKVLLTTNQSLNIDGPSAQDRFWTFELCQYFNAERSPAQEFGCWFFSKDWSAQEWAAFDAFNIQCLQAYFAHGMYKSASLVFEQKQILDSFGRDFLQWATDLIEGENLKFKPEPVTAGPLKGAATYWIELPRIAAVEQFIEEYGEKGKYIITERGKDKELTSAIFGKWLKKYCSLTPSVLPHTAANVKKYKLDTKAGGTQYFVIAII